MLDLTMRPSKYAQIHSIQAQIHNIQAQIHRFIRQVHNNYHCITHHQHTASPVIKEQGYSFHSRNGTKKIKNQQVFPCQLPNQKIYTLPALYISNYRILKLPYLCNMLTKHILPPPTLPNINTSTLPTCCLTKLPLPS